MRQLLSTFRLTCIAIAVFVNQTPSTTATHHVLSFLFNVDHISLTSSSSPKITLLSLCPVKTHPMPLSFNCSALISPVKAPFGLSKTFCDATSMLLRRCSRASSRKSPGGAMITSTEAVSGNPGQRGKNMMETRIKTCGSKGGARGGLHTSFRI